MASELGAKVIDPLMELRYAGQREQYEQDLAAYEKLLLKKAHGKPVYQEVDKNQDPFEYEGNTPKRGIYFVNKDGSARVPPQACGADVHCLADDGAYGLKGHRETRFYRGPPRGCSL